MDKDKIFYVGQKAFIDKGGKILVLIDPVYGLDFPGGKIQEGENNLIESLKREVREETNLEIEVENPFFVWHFTFPFHPEHRNSGKTVYLVGFRCRYISGDFIISDEHEKFMWVDKSNYKELNDGSDYFKALEKYFSNYR